MKARALALGAFLAIAGGSQAYVQTFEDLSTGSFTSIGTGGYPVDVHFYAVGGPGSFMVVDEYLSSYSWLHRSLLPYDGSNIIQMVFNFSTTLQAVSIEMGDYDGDDDHFYLEAYSGLDGTGTQLGLDTALYTWDRSIAVGDFETLSVTAPGIRSIVAWGSGIFDYSNSYMDNLNMIPVPEPASLAVLALGVFALGRRRR